VLLSVASVWEIVVKATGCKLPFPEPVAPYIREQIRQTRVEVLPIVLSHVLRLESLPMRHRDPFDRILVAQALEERIPLVSRDRTLGGYGVEILW
jgi:PIN domain nuclease of toxin-antitoxin system